jgi:hypothetical protein
MSILSLYQDLEPASADGSRCACSSRRGRFAQWHRRSSRASSSRAAIGIALSRGGRDGTHSREALSEMHCFVSYTVAADGFNHRVCRNLVEQIRQHAGIVDILMPSAAHA